MKPLVLGLGGISSVGVVSTGVYWYVSSSKTVKDESKEGKIISLREVLKNDKWILLTKSNTEEITKILEAYKKNNPKATLQFDGLTGNEDNASDLLLKKCEDLHKKPFEIPSKEDFLNRLTKWCVVPKTVSQRLEDLGYSPLSTEGPSQGTTESESWKQKGQSYSTDSRNKFTGINITGNDDASAKALREHCKTKLESKSFEEEFQDTLGKVKIWCSDPKS